MQPKPDAVLRLHVRNHPGVMSHVCGLFARRLLPIEEGRAHKNIK